MAINTIRLDGFIGTDPELRFSGKGTPWCTFRLAHPKRKKDGDKWVDDGTIWIECKAFNKDAERLAELGKSCPITVEGKFELDEWNDRETGQKRTKPVILLDSWHFTTRSLVPMGELREGNLKGVSVGWKYADRQAAVRTGPRHSEPVPLGEEPF